MSFTDAINTSVGQATESQTPNKLADNTEANRAWIDNDHDADISTGDGAHKVTASVTLPSSVKTAENATRIIYVDLRDQRWMWDLPRFRQMSRNTSWYAEVGHMPTRMLIWIDSAQNSVHIWDASAMTEWMVFTAGSTNMLYSTSTISDIDFADGILYAGGVQVPVIDFARDECRIYTTGGMYRYLGDISERDDGNGILEYNNAIGLIVNSTVNAVAAIRDPLGEVENDTGRPKHRVLIGTGGEYSVSDAGITTFYDSDVAASPTGLDVILLSDGNMFWVLSEGTRDYFQWWYAIETISADSWSANESWANTGSGSEDLPWSNSAVMTRADAIANASVCDGASPVVIFGSDEGLAICHTKEGDNANGLTFILNSTANWPPYSGTVVDVWALEDVTGLFGKDLTNNNAVTFTAGVVGNCATFDGVNQYLNRTGDSDLNPSGGNFSISGWVKPASASNPGATERFFQLRNSGTTDNWALLQFTTSGYLQFAMQKSGAGGDAATFSQDIYDGNWHHVVAQVDGTNLVLWVDGIQVATDSYTTTTGDLGFDQISLGADNVGSSPFAGSFDHLSYIQGRVLSEDEIRFLYQQGLSAMQSTVNTTTNSLDSDDVDYVQVSNDGQYIALGNQSEMVILDRYGIPILVDGPPDSDNIQDVAVWVEEGTDDPSYAIAASSSVETVQQNPVLLNK